MYQINFTEAPIPNRISRSWAYSKANYNVNKFTDLKLQNISLKTGHKPVKTAADRNRSKYHKKAANSLSSRGLRRSSWNPCLT
jgi:hypothetical protein